MSSCQNNAVVMDSLFHASFVFIIIHFAYLKAYHQILPKLEMKQALMLLTSDILSYNLPD